MMLKTIRLSAEMILFNSAEGVWPAGVQKSAVLDDRQEAMEPMPLKNCRTIQIPMTISAGT